MAAETSETPATGPGRLIGGRYRLQAELGVGGFGRVWRARDENLDRMVAVKEVWMPVMPPAEKTERLARAEREVRNAAALADHPHIVTVYDVVVQDGMPWMVMQHVEGSSLHQLLEARGRLPAAEVESVARAVLSALGAAHKVGIVHRDIKPGNILVATTGEVLLTDFGIAVAEDDASLTVTGSFLGTMEYTAPERVEGKDGNPASDLFSLGATLFEAVEGRSPFRRDTKAGTLSALLVQPTPPMPHAGRLGRLIEALMRKNPDERPSVQAALALLDGTYPETAPAHSIPQAPPTEPGIAIGAGAETMGQPRPAWMPGNVYPTVDAPLPLPLPPGPGKPKPSAKTAAAIGGTALAAVLGVTLAAVVTNGGDATPQPSPTPDTVAQQALAPTIAPSTVYLTQSAQTSDTTTQTTSDSSSDTPPATTSSSPAFAWTDLDSSSTDTTPQTTDAMLPRTFTDSDGRVYNLVAADTRACVDSFETDSVQSILNSNHCSALVDGAYVNTPGTILVSVEVLTFADKNTATSVESQLKNSTHTGDMGWYCPKSGAGSNVCDGQITDGAMREGWLSHQHRYVFNADAIYVNMATSGNDNALSNGSSKAIDVVGPDYYWDKTNG